MSGIFFRLGLAFLTVGILDEFRHWKFKAFSFGASLLAVSAVEFYFSKKGKK